VQQIPGAELKIYAGEPHGIFYTQKDSLNQNLIDFIFDRKENYPKEETELENPLENPLRFPNTGLI
jgi:non-heme chloroperoxidase